MERLVGKTIVSVCRLGFEDKIEERRYVDEPMLRLEFSDGTRLTLRAYAGGYCEDARDEYPLGIEVMSDDDVAGLDNYCTRVVELDEEV